ncbi:MAG: DUF5675 family protein [Cellulosilyticum sp.]|nr:DUF5675 family protein [Cellulosilyticum sp.]
MNISVYRKYKKESYTIGKLHINGDYFCDTLEDKDRGLNQNMPLSYIKDNKVYGKTAIPIGNYKVSLDITSPRFSQMSFYKEVCEGKVPRILNVPAFEGILFHVADGPKGAELLQGCIGVGRNKIKGGLLEGKDYFKKLYNKLKEAKDRGEEINLTIQ